MFNYIGKLLELFCRVLESNYTKGYLFFALICIVIPNAMDILLIRLLILIPIALLLFIIFLAVFIAAATPVLYLIFKKYADEHDLNIKNKDDKSLSFATVSVKAITVSIIFLLFTLVYVLSFFLSQ